MAYSKPLDYLQRPIVVIGAGTLGMRIALMMATQGGEVRIFDLSTEQRAKARTFIDEHLPPLLARLPGSCPARIVLADELTKALRNAWLIYEVIPERLELKKTLFGQLDKLAPLDAILASNSSSFLSSQFIDEVSQMGRTRVVNTHFYMPPVQNAVEIMSCGVTDPAVIDTLVDILPAYGGLVPFRVQKESVGFIFNRVWAAIKRECLEVVATGVSTPADVDHIYKVSTGAPIGPFRLMDQVGLDIVLAIEEHYVTLNSSLPSGPVDFLRTYVSAGKLGVKSGCGFYDDYAQVETITPN